MHLVKLGAALILVAVVSADAAFAACRDRPGTPTQLRVATKGPTSLEVSWENRATERPIYWDVEILDGSGRTVGAKPAGTPYGGEGLGNRAVATFGVPQHITQCFRVKARTAAGSEGCVSEQWSAPVCGNTRVYGAIGDKWSTAGADRSPVGAPLGDESQASRGGRFQTFRNGHIFWTRNTGAHMVYGSIRAKWDQLGRENGKCGFPVSDEIDASNGNRRSNFEFGSLLWVRANSQVLDQCGASANPRETLRNTMEAYFDNNRPTLERLFVANLTKPDLIAGGFTLYEMNLKFGDLNIQFPSPDSIRIQLNGNYIYTKSTQPTAAGSYADPAVELHVDLLLTGRMIVGPGGKPKVQDLVAQVSRLEVKPRSVVAGAMTTLIRLFQMTENGAAVIQRIAQHYLVIDLTNEVNRRIP